MANICNQNLYVVAETADDMRDLLAIMSEHFKKATDVDLSSGLSSLAGWKEYANAIATGASNYNKLCLLADEPDTRSEGGFFSSCYSCGMPCILIDMELKWGPSFQVKEFCESLDASKYGFASINGGEYMCAMGEDSEIAFIQWGEDFGDPFSGGLSCSEYVKMAEEYKGKASGDLHELALRKLFEREQVDSFFWETSQAYGYSDESFEYEPYGEKSWWMTIDWRKPSADDVEKICSAAIDILADMPIANTLRGGWTKEGNEAVENLLPGDAVLVDSKWSTDHVELWVSTTDRKQIGYVDYWYETQADCDPETADMLIALVLPHVKVTVNELTPLSLRNAGVQEPIMSVRFDALPVDFAEVLSEVRSTLGKKLSERSTTSSLE